MLRIARETAPPPNVAWQLGSSADLSPALGRFRLVAMGRSFHWMDRSETLRRLDALIYERRPVTPETLVDRALSMSSTSRERLGDRADAIRDALPPPPLTELVLSEAIVAFRRGSAPE